MTEDMLYQGAEAKICKSRYMGFDVVEKRRIRKSYRIPEIDSQLISYRTKEEAKLMIEARKNGISVPIIFDVDIENGFITMEYLKGKRIKDIFNNIKQRCSESGRFYFIDNPREIAVTEVIAISDINITMGMGSPSTIALLCGKIGLYYDTTGNDHHPFTKKYRNKVVFDSKSELFSAVNKMIDGAYSPLSEIDEELLEDYDRFRDNMGLERFRDALLANL